MITKLKDGLKDQIPSPEIHEILDLCCYVAKYYSDALPDEREGATASFSHSSYTEATQSGAVSTSNPTSSKITSTTAVQEKPSKRLGSPLEEVKEPGDEEDEFKGKKSKPDAN
jgi:hypothetical protein